MSLGPDSVSPLILKSMVDVSVYPIAKICEHCDEKVLTGLSSQLTPQYLQGRTADLTEAHDETLRQCLTLTLQQWSANSKH